MNKKEAVVIVIVGGCISHAIYDYVKGKIKETIRRKKELTDARRWFEAWAQYSGVKKEGESEEVCHE